MTIELTQDDAKLLRTLLSAELHKIEEELVHTDQRKLQREIAGDVGRVRALIQRLGLESAA
ncbi:MAG TPA: hypothetical protein VIV58_11725 [Kofleriaceae bacterium]